MNSKLLIGTGVILAMSLLALQSLAQVSGDGVYWRIDPGVEECSMVIDASLTQPQWRKFVQQSGDILSFKTLAPATTLGKGRFNVSVDRSTTPVDQRDLAWINTFTHPDESCPLGDEITIPTIRASAGLTDNMDIGGFWTTAPNSNYGGVGGEVKYGIVRESGRYPAVAARASFTILTGVPDFNFNAYGLELMASKKVAMLTPYIGFRGNLFIGTETTPKVDLNQERLLAPQGYAGVAYSIWKLRLAAEYDLSFVNSFVAAVGITL